MNRKTFLVTGATSGFGAAITELLIDNGHYVLGNARTAFGLQKLEENYPGRFKGVTGDICKEETQQGILNELKGSEILGVVVNAGGPKPGNFSELEMTDWDDAYNLVLRWKISFVDKILPRLLSQNYGRVVFIESMSVKQPISNLLLSNVYRMAVVGLAKSLALQYAGNNITFNTVAPGYHSTPALQRVIKNKSEKENKPTEEVIAGINSAIPSGRLGEAHELASL
ncbi:MAG: SDR family NAD(P)-dependent oxidoreductase, partial [Bacteroidales bacterium]|nr:SDR family NAD(P)-dependent oxidoreductase [Bacteroidales bacterium]